jgi:pilus assembly protein CpaE
MAKVLFIDDEPLYYRQIQPVFKEQGHDLHYAKTGMEGLAEVLTFVPDVIITDVRLPDLTGYEIADRLRRDPRFNRIPIIFVTGQGELKDKLKAFELGADDYLVKPFQPEELVARLGILLRRTEALKAVSNLEATNRQTATIVAVHSLRGGVGCSSIAVNLAIAFQQLWAKSSIILDGVLNSGHVGLMLNSSPQVTWADFAGVQPKDIDLEGYSKLVRSHNSGVKFIASPTVPIAPDSFVENFWPGIINYLSEMNHFIVLDTPHDFSNISIQMLTAASNIILVISPEVASLRSAVGALTIYQKLRFDPNRIFVVVNQVFDASPIKQAQIEKVIHRRVDMMIPYIPNEFIRAVNYGEPFVHKNPDSPITGLFEDAAYWLSNDIHKNIPPAAPTQIWRRVNNRLKTLKT